MRTVVAVLAVLTFVMAGGLIRGEGKPAAENRLAPLGRFVGAWEVDGKWSNGESLHARNTYEWGLGKNILKAKTFVRNGDSEYQRYEAILAWHPEKKCLFQISFAYDGGMTESLVEARDEDTIRIGWTPFHRDKPSKVRQVIKFLDDNHFRWTVEIQDGATWQQLIEATWKRTSK